MRGMISAKAQDGALMGIEGLIFDYPKTKDANSVLVALKSADKRSLIVCAGDSSAVVKKSFANLTGVRCVDVKYLNPRDVLWAQAIVFSKDAIDYVNTLA